MNSLAQEIENFFKTASKEEIEELLKKSKFDEYNKIGAPIILPDDESNIRFGLCLQKDKPFVDAVLDTFDEQEEIRRREREAFKAEIKKLREENQNYKEAYFDQWYDRREIERCWAVINNYNRKHLELHEALREYIRNREWVYDAAYEEAKSRFE